MRTAALASCLAWAACSDAAPTPRPSALPSAPQDGTAPVLEALEHDYGTIPHPESRSHDFVVDVQRLGVRCIPLRTHLDCSCGRAEMLLRSKDGHERIVDGSPNPDNAPGPGESLVVRVTIDTVTKEAVDLPAVTSHGQVVLQPIEATASVRRIQWPLVLRYGIDVPVDVHPFTALDFGKVPMCTAPELQTAIRGDRAHAAWKFPSVASSDPAIEASLTPEDGGVRLHVRCRPGEPGNHRCLVSVATDDASGYRVNFPVTWKVVPDIEANPMAKISFRADPTHEQDEASAVGQFVVVTDHDARRPAEFVVSRIVDDAGNDASKHFAVRIEAVPGQPRQTRVTARYLGGLTDGFRGTVVLAKDAAAGPTLPLELAMFSSLSR
ncbi:MAG: hypothetical protein JNK78_15585 [Planctomycetes bacterium]|nr:hypothetical protein [Planctomycetota bacterium]